MLDVPDIEPKSAGDSPATPPQTDTNVDTSTIPPPRAGDQGENGSNAKKECVQKPKAWQITPEPWHEPVDGADLLDTLMCQYNRFLFLPPSAAFAMTLWTVFTYSSESGCTAPFLALLSPEKRCGKTTALGVCAELVHRGLPASNISPASVFRVIERDKPTLLIDEVDSFLKDNEPLRGILNAGFTRASAFVIRTVGENHEPKAFSVFGPKLLAGIGKLPGTLADRSIIIHMQRKHKGEKAERFRGFDGQELRRKCVRWTQDNRAKLDKADPTMPETLNDRAADMWQPLVAIADAAGGSWPSRARDAASCMSADGEGDDDSQGVMLLTDCRACLSRRISNSISSEDLLAHLNGLEEQPWRTLSRGLEMTARQLADRLRPFRISSKTVRDGADTAKGYSKDSFADAFARYLSTRPE